MNPWKRAARFWWAGALVSVGVGMVSEAVMRGLLKPPWAWYLWDYGQEGFSKVVRPDGSLPTNLETGLIRGEGGKPLTRQDTDWGNQVRALVGNRTLET